MSRYQRHTEPVFTRDGRLDSYEQIERVLSQAEAAGRVWTLQRANDPAIAERSDAAARAPTAGEILELHKAMFGHVFDWAGQPRRANIGPGGQVWIDWPMVLLELHNLAEDIRAWIAGQQGSGLNLGTVSDLIADAHHRFQRVHPFEDTNGRTGRVLDHYYLWVTFGLRGATLAASPFLEYFPSAEHETEYYEGLREADAHDPVRLRRYYRGRVKDAVTAWQTEITTGRADT